MPDLLRGGIAINEVLIDPNVTGGGFDTDGNGTAAGGDEFLELINTSSTAIDISGLQLWDAGQDNWFTFPPGTSLAAGAKAIVVRKVQVGGDLPTVTGDNLAFNADFRTEGNPSNIFNNGGDNIVVYDPTADQFVQATYNGDALDDPTGSTGYAGFSATATRVGDGENFGNDVDGSSIQRVPDGFITGQGATPGVANVCFTSGTLIAAPDGFRRIEDLAIGDLVLTKDAGPQKLRWIYARTISALELLGNPRLCPVVIPTQMAPLRVSRHHRIMVAGKIARRMFDTAEVLVPAKDLVGVCGITMQRATMDVTYYHLLCDHHHILNAHGIAAESLYLGAEGVNAMTPAARAELQMIFHDTAVPALCRASVTGQRARRLAYRHKKNDKILDMAF